MGKELELFPLVEPGVSAKVHFGDEVKGNEIRLANGWRVVLQVEPPLPLSN